jgi:hypothetical protein
MTVPTLESLRSANLLDKVNFEKAWPLHRARNNAVEQFLKSDADRLVWVDDDVVIPANINDFLQMNAPLCAPLAWTFKHKIPVPGVYKWVREDLVARGGDIMASVPKAVMAKCVEEANAAKLPPLLGDIDIVAGGIYMATREVFEKTRDQDGLWFRDTWKDPYGKMRIGEDVYFFYMLCRPKGYKFIVNLGVECGHIHPFDIALIGALAYGRLMESHQETVAKFEADTINLNDFKDIPIDEKFERKVA